MSWACGEKYYYSLDTDKNTKQDDPGALVVNNLKTRERIRCDLWKDEINNLLTSGKRWVGLSHLRLLIYIFAHLRLCEAVSPTSSSFTWCLPSSAGNLQHL